MTKKQYEIKRNGLLTEAQNLIDLGKTQEAQDKMNEVTMLDEQWDAIIRAQADFNALNGEPRESHPFGMFHEGMNLRNTNQLIVEENLYDTDEYRHSFMNYVVKGTSIPSKFKNANQVTTTKDVGAVIPPAVIQKIYEKMESVGMILPLATRTSFAAGTTVPVSSVKPVATWVAEGKGSDKQKKALGSIDIKGYKLRCEVAITLETAVMTLELFEATLISNVSEAMVKAQEQAMINGDGEGKPEGVLHKTVDADKKVEVAKTGKLSYKTLTSAEGALPLAHENGAVWNMTKKTFMEFMGMVDDNNRPIALINYGVDGKPERTLLGRKVVLNEYMESYKDSVEADTVVAFLYDWSQYVLNTNYSMTIKAYEDNDTEDQMTKAIMICDGKPASIDSLVTITKKSA